MALTCISCKKKIRDEKTAAPVYLYAKNDEGEKVELVYHLHPECYDMIAQTVRVAGTKPYDETLSENEYGSESL